MNAFMSNTVFRDNIRGNRLVPVSQGVLDVVRTRAFQRLRSIKQMGLSSLVFPTAEHSRFAHSLGVYATAKETFRALKIRSERLSITFPGMRFDDDAEQEFCMAAMCHDIGHTAFSHVLEDVLLPHGMTNHEDCTLKLLESDTELGAAIKNSTDLQSVLYYINGDHANIALTQLISGLFDLDRCDYLLRDSHNCGVQYGQFDFPWLLHAMSVDLNYLGQPILVLDGPRGIDALRQFLSARRHMYRQVYYQPTIRGGQILLKGIFERLGERPMKKSKLPAVPQGLKAFASGEPVSQEDFLNTTDVEVTYFINVLANTCDDPILNDLCNMFVQRRLPKAVLDSAKASRPLSESIGLAFPKAAENFGRQLDFFGQDDVDEMEFLLSCRTFVESKLKAQGRNPSIAQYTVNSERIIFQSVPPTDIVVAYGDGKVPLEELAERPAMRGLPEISESFELYRLYAPVEYRDQLHEFIRNQYGNGAS